jgi:lysophospholipase L1-like esterase
MNSRMVGFGFFFGGASLVGGQVVYARLRRLPAPSDLDPSGTFGDPTMPSLRLTLLGDSSITGQGLDRVEDSWPRVIAHRLSDRFHLSVRSYAVGGSTSRDVLVDQLPRAEREDHDIVILSVGSNDLLRATPVWLLERRLDQIVGRLKAVASSVVLFGVGDLGSIPRLLFPIDKLAAASGHVADWAHRRVADRHGVAKIDQWGLTTEAFNSGLHMFSPDLFHPSAEGHLAWADAVLPTVEDELNRLGLASRSQATSSDH